MWRLVLIGMGAYIGYRLAKMGRSRYNLIMGTGAAAIAYKLTRDRMASTGEIAENGVRYKDVEAEIMEA